MKRILVISGSRADYGLLEWPVKVLSESFQVVFLSLKASDPSEAFMGAKAALDASKPDCLLILGDRWEILQAAIAAHLQRIPIAHIAGGDVTLGSYDDAMRDCISRLATYHFPTSKEASLRLKYEMRMEGEVHMIGNIAMDYILHGDWKREKPYDEPYVVVNYQPETIERDFGAGSQIANAVFGDLPLIKRVIIRPNTDHGSELVNDIINGYERIRDDVIDQLPHAEYLNLIYHCEEFIGNSSSMLYEAPALGVKTRLIGKRQEGRVVPTGDGKASERIREVLCQCL